MADTSQTLGTFLQTVSGSWATPGGRAGTIDILWLARAGPTSKGPGKRGAATERKTERGEQPSGKRSAAIDLSEKTGRGEQPSGKRSAAIDLSEKTERGEQPSGKRKRGAAERKEKEECSERSVREDRARGWARVGETTPGRAGLHDDVPDRPPRRVDLVCADIIYRL